MIPSSFRRRLKYLPGFLAAAIILQSCFSDPGYWKNGQISEGKRTDFHELNNQVLKCLKTNDINKLSFLESKELMQNTDALHQEEIMGNSLNSNNYELLDEYYVVNKYKDYDTVINNVKTDNSYKLVYGGATQEMYIAFFVPKTGNDKWMISAIYCKFNYGWKLDEIDYDMYTLNGKTAPELLNLAKEQMDKNYIVNAVNDIELAHYCLRPSAIWLYLNENIISAYYNSITATANNAFKLPMVLKQVPTHPRIFRVFNMEFKDNYYPMIYYQTSIKMADTAAIKAENEHIKKVIAGVFPGIDKGNAYVLYTAFNELPNPEKTVDRFEIDAKQP